MADSDAEPGTLSVRLQALRERLLRGEPQEGVLQEIVRLESAIAALQERLDSVELGYRMLEAALIERDVLIAAGEIVDQLPGEAEIAADHLLEPDGGFYGLEFDPQERPFRWTGPAPQFRFTLYVDRNQPLELEARFLWACDPAIFPGIQCYADRRLVPLQYSEQDGEHLLSGRIPARSRPDPGATTLIFVLPKVMPVSEMNPGSTDARVLGVAFRALRLRAAATQRDQDVTEKRPRLVSVQRSRGKGE